MNRRPAFLHWLQPGAVRQLHRYYQDAMTPCRHPAALRFLRLAVPRMHSLLSLPGGRVRRQDLELVTRYLRPGIRRGANRVLPSSWGTTIVRLHMFQSDAGRTACTRPSSTAAWPLVIERQGLPRLGLSTLNSMAFGLAVYASQCGLLQHHARLASSCWSGSTGRAFHPQGSDERFQICRLHLIPLSQAFLGAIDVTEAGWQGGHSILWSLHFDCANSTMDVLSLLDPCYPGFVRLAGTDVPS